MKRALLLIVVPALLVALGFAQTPAASINTDQSNIKGCLGGSVGNYTVVQDNTGRIFKITTSSVDLKPHVGHDVTLIGHRASGTGSAAADNSFAVTELNMISEHCAAAVAAAAPTATVSTPSETASTPAAAAVGPAATTSTVAETAITPATATAAPAATVTTPAETAVTPAAAAAPPAETVVTPAATPPAETVSTPSETVSTPVEGAVHPTRRPEHARRLPAAPAAAAAAPAETVTTPAETVVTPAAATTTPAATASTPAAAATTPTAPARSWSSWILIPFAVLVIVLATLVPVFSKWRKRKMLERTGAQNLSFNREESSDKARSDSQGPRKAA